MAERLGLRVIVSGRVQGVGFRAFVLREAVARSVAGHVRNLRDGRVEALFCGPLEDVVALCEACGRGPAGASVENVEVVDMPAGLDVAGFSVLRDG